MKKMLVFAIVIALLGIGVIILSSKRTSSTNTMSTNQSTTQPMETNLPIQMENSKYITYSESALSKSANTRRILFFYANWCPTCRPADADLKQNESKIPQDVTIIRVNYNDTETDQQEKDLATKYGITYQHTFVQIDSTGNVISKWNGGSLDQILANIK